MFEKSSKTILAARVLLGSAFVVFGSNYFLQFLPHSPVPEAAGTYLGALAASGLIFPIIKPIEIAAGLMLLSGRWIPLALVLLAPIVVNIVGFHAVLAPGGLGLALALLGLGLVLAWAHREAFRPLFDAPTRLATPRESTSSAHLGAAPSHG
jgi:hypothetical protein